MISAGTLLAKTPREVGGTQDITGGLPRVTELFEARRPKEPAVIAEIDGRVELLDEKRRGKRTIIVRNESGIEREHLVPHGKYLRVHGGDRVRAGDPLVEGPLVPHDILRISGEEAVQRYLLREIQNVYRSQRVEIDDKHLEIIIAQMLRKVRVESVGDTPLLPGSVIDKFEFRRVNQDLMTCVKIKDPGDVDFRVGDIVPRDHFEQENLRAEAAGLEEGRVDSPQAGGGQHAASGNHQGGRPVRQLHLGRQLPGDDQGPDRGGPGRQGRHPGRSQGKRHPGPPRACGNRLQDPSGSRSAHSPRGARGTRRQRPGLRPLSRRGPGDGRQELTSVERRSQRIQTCDRTFVCAPRARGSSATGRHVRPLLAASASTKRSFAACQLNPAAIDRPSTARRDRSWPSSSSRRRAAVIASSLAGSKYHPASPPISGSAVESARATGVPCAIASTAGMPKLSQSDGKTSAVASA